MKAAGDIARMVAIVKSDDDPERLLVPAMERGVEGSWLEDEKVQGKMVVVSREIVCIAKTFTSLG